MKKRQLLGACLAALLLAATAYSDPLPAGEEIVFASEMILNESGSPAVPFQAGDTLHFSLGSEEPKDCEGTVWYLCTVTLEPGGTGNLPVPLRILVNKSVPLGTQVIISERKVPNQCPSGPGFTAFYIASTR